MTRALSTLAFDAIVATLNLCFWLVIVLTVGVAGAVLILFCVPLWAFMAAVAEVRRWGSAA